MNERDTVLEMLREEFPYSEVVERGGDIHIEAKGPGVCDFCEEQLVTETTTTYDANPVQIDFPGCPPFISEGSWDACPVCALLINRNRRRALLENAVERAVTLSDTARRASAGARAGLAVAHDAFWTSKKP